jgi:pimeloyl-ACP methyl ester carboxylesterase
VRVANLVVHLDENFDEWGSEKELWLLERLTEIAGCSIDDATVLRRRRGCVMLYINLPDEAAARLEHDFKAGMDGEEFTHEALIALVNEIVGRYNVVSIRADIPKDAPTVSTAEKSGPPLFVLVHGWKGSRNSFGSLPEILEEELGAEIAIPEYKSQFRKGGDPIFILGAQLSNFINNRTFKSDRDVAVIGHSMGGVVTRASLVESLRDRDRHYARFVKLVVSVASPLTGTWFGSLASYIPGRFTVMKQAAELSAKSPTLVETRRWWGQWVKENDHLADNIRSIYSSDDGIVPMVSAAGEDRNAVCIPGAGHSDIIKPKSADDEIARTLIRFANEAKIV